MQELEGIHHERFYRQLIEEATLVEERIEGETEDGELQTFYGFEDAEDEAQYEGATLLEYGEAYFHKDEKVYMCTIYFENMECVGVNILDKEEIKDFVANLLESEHGDEDALIEKQPWTKDFL